MVELAVHLLVNNSARHKIPKLCALQFEIYRFCGDGGTGRAASVK